MQDQYQAAIAAVSTSEPIPRQTKRDSVFSMLSYSQFDSMRHFWPPCLRTTSPAFQFS